MVLPQSFIAPFGGPAAALMIAGDVVWFAVLLLAPPALEGRRRPLLPFLAAAVSLGAALILAVPYWQVWTGNGLFWCAMNLSKIDPRLVENLLVWVPVLLLSGSLALATISREKPGKLALWAVLTSPGLLIALMAAALLGLTGIAS